jgi:predicted DNA-binding transcriptional regulator AlpA
MGLHRRRNAAVTINQQDQEIQMAKRSNANPSGPSRLAFSIDEVCEAFGFCRAKFYLDQAAGVGPKTMKINKSVRVSQAALQTWVAEREAAAQGK